MPWPESAFTHELNENPMSSLWVAEGTGHPDILGVIVVWYIVDEVHIATLAVHPTYRGRGIAKRLLGTALEEAYNKGMQIATLEVRANNTAAQQLYRSFGFEIAGYRPRYYRDNNEDAIIMSLRPLSGPITTKNDNERPYIARKY